MIQMFDIPTYPSYLTFLKTTTIQDYNIDHFMIDLGKKTGNSGKKVLKIFTNNIRNEVHLVHY